MDGEANGSQESTQGAQEEVQQQAQSQQAASMQVDGGNEAGNAPAPDYERQIDLCQDFGHESSRPYAAIGTVSDLGAVRSKNAPMASAGTLCPMVECGLLRL